MRVAAALLLAASVCGAETWFLPRVSPDFDAIAVMLPGGRIPQIPWEGFPDIARERFWAYSCSGLLMGRSAWSAYLLVTPPGTSGQFLEAAGMLETSYMLSDTSVWGRALMLEATGAESSVTIVWSDSVGGSVPQRLPLRRSAWLAAGPDTLIVNGTWDNNLFLWSPDSGDAGLSGAAWRGIGTEVVPTGAGSCIIAAASASEGTPANLSDYLASENGWDSSFASPWGLLLEAMDSLVASMYPVSAGGGNLVWLKGTGSGSAVEPWVMLPGPPAPARTRQTMPWPLEISRAPHPDQIPETPIVHRLMLPYAGTGDMALVLAGVLERLMARSALPGIPGAVSVQVEVVPDSLEVILVGDIAMDGSALRARITELLATTALSPPESSLVSNATLRASFRTGRWIAMPARSDIVMGLASALGLAGGSGF